MGVGKNITWKKGKVKQYHLYRDIMAILLGRISSGEEGIGQGDESFGEEFKFLKMG